MGKEDGKGRTALRAMMAMKVMGTIRAM